MPAKFDTSVLDRKVIARRLENENQRKELLEKVLKGLEELHGKFDFERAWLFGSITKEFKLRPDSDVDIAVEGLPSDQFLAMAAKLSSFVGREVDLQQLEECRFADRIKEEGTEWKKAH